MDKEYATGKWDHCEDTSGAWVYGFIEKYARGGSILDLGCGAGNTGNELNGTTYRDYSGIDVSEVAVRKATQRSAASGRADKNRYIQSDILTYVPKQSHDLILFRESIYDIPQSMMKSMLDHYARHLTPGGVFVAYLSRDGTSQVREIVKWIEDNYRVIENAAREAPAPDAARYHGDAFVLVFR
jgi:2-polyprenyl-6-hydroxyphenyl methylase/3-demethylubiquinone-9 3-methyltransferase